MIPAAAAASSAVASSRRPTPRPRTERDTMSLTSSARWRLLGLSGRARLTVPVTRSPSRATQTASCPAATAAARPRHQCAASA